MKYHYITDTGKLREHNEDSVVAIENESKEILLVVADGMGGHNAGEVASSIAVSHIGKRFKSSRTIGSKEDAAAWLQEAVNEINVLIYKHTDQNPSSIGMGTTLVVSIITPSFTIIGNIGDSAGYVIRNSKLYKITTDHTLVNLLVKSGELTEEEAKNHPRKNVLMKALGAAKVVEMDMFDIDKDIDAVFLCSDGLTNMLNDTQIEKVLLNTELTIEEKLQKLVYKANNRGGNDNISIAYTEIGGAM